MINKVTLIGNLGGAIETIDLPSGSKGAKFSLATSESWKDKDGNKQEKTEWHRVVIFNDGLVGVLEKYATKGTKLYIEGSLKTRKYTDSSGVEKYTTEVVVQNYGDTVRMLGGKSEGKSESFEDSTPPTGENDATNGFNDDDIPF